MQGFQINDIETATGPNSHAKSAVDKVIEIAVTIGKAELPKDLSREVVFKAAVQVAFNKLGDPITF